MSDFTLRGRASCALPLLETEARPPLISVKDFVVFFQSLEPKDDPAIP